jgi:hypothetical protein
VAGLSSQIAGANAAIVTANTAMKSYVDAGNTTMTAYVGNQVTTANTAVVGYVNTLNTAMSANVAGANAAVVTANTAVVSYVNAKTNSLATGANANTAAYLAANISTTIGTTGTVYAGNLFVGTAVGTAYYSAPMSITVSNAGNVVSTLNLFNTAGGGGSGSAIDLYTYSGAGYPPEARIFAIDNADYSANISFANKIPGAGTNALKTNMTLTSSGNLIVPNSIQAGNIIVNGQPTTYGVANPAYAYVYLNTSTSYTNSAFDMVFDTIGTSSGITYSTSTGLFSLTAGVTYELETNLYVQFEGSAGYIANYQWVDSSNNALSPTQGQAIPVTSAFNDSGVASQSLIYTPSQNINVKVRWIGVYGGRMLVQGIKTWAKVKQLNPTIAVQATATGTVSKNYAKYVRTTAQTVSAGAVVVCSTLESSSGTAVSVNTSTGQVTLTAGTYRLRGTVGSIAGATAASFIGYGWYNETTSAYIGEGSGWFSPQSLNYNTTAGGTAEAVITVASTTVVSFRVLSPTNVSSIGGTSADWGTPYAYPWIDIEQMGATFALNALDTMSVTGNVSVGGNLTVTGGIRKSARVLTTTTTLTVADASGFIELYSGPYTVTLPDPTQAANSGIGYRFWQNTVSNITLSTPAGGFYGPSGSSTSTKVLAQATTQYWDVWSDGYNWAVFGIKIA